MCKLCCYYVYIVYCKKKMLPQDMKRCSVCTLRKSDGHFIRKERIWRSCNECSKSRRKRKKSTMMTKPKVENVTESKPINKHKQMLESIHEQTQQQEDKQLGKQVDESVDNSVKDRSSIKSSCIKCVINNR